MKTLTVIVVYSDSDWVLNVKRKIYGQHQADRVWNNFLVGKVTSSAVSFRQSKFDKYVFCHVNIIYIL